jgi:hypothetical protein
MDVVLCEPARSTELWAWLMILHGSGYFEVGGFHRRTTLETCDKRHRNERLYAVRGAGTRLSRKLLREAQSAL